MTPGCRFGSEFSPLFGRFPSSSRALATGEFRRRDGFPGRTAGDGEEVFLCDQSCSGRFARQVWCRSRGEARWSRSARTRKPRSKRGVGWQTSSAKSIAFCQTSRCSSWNGRGAVLSKQGIQVPLAKRFTALPFQLLEIRPGAKARRAAGQPTDTSPKAAGRSGCFRSGATTCWKRRSPVLWRSLQPS